MHRQLHRGLAEEVRHRPVHVAGVLPHEDGPLGGEGQEQRLRRAEHATDAKHRHRSGVRLHVVLVALHQVALLGVHRANPEENQGVDDRQENGRAESGAQGAFVAYCFLDLALAQRDRLLEKTLALGDRWQRSSADVFQQRPSGLRLGPACGDGCDLLLIAGLDDEHHEVRRVVVLRAPMPDGVEVIADSGRVSVVHHLACHQEDGLVKEVEDLRTRLVDGA
mmetsp:Transcript_136031/g.435093  ORF Transcript_136031/g.435093 Transcript_136031/m.435093 type:complete len:222 (-) Transcript_136031:872-1537(-)